MSSLQTFRLSYRALQKTVAWQRCKQFLSRHLLIINTGTCTSLYVTGDLVQQTIEGPKGIDWARSLRMAVLGFVMGPVNHGWYKMLDLIVKGSPGRTVVFKKVLADQLFMAPIGICVFFGGMCALEGRTLAQTAEELRTKSWPTYRTINFYLVPTYLRVTYVNIATFFWTIYLSYMKHKWTATEDKSSIT